MKRDMGVRVGRWRAVTWSAGLVLASLWGSPFAVGQGAAGSSSAQAAPSQASSPAPIKVEARLVVVPVVVRDKKGALIRDLKREEFSIKVGGKEQPIRYFDHTDDTPLTLGLLVDVSRSQRGVLDEEKQGSEAFLHDMLRAHAGTPTPAAKPVAGQQAGTHPAAAVDSDRAFVMQFAKPIELLQDVTDDRGKLASALHELGTPSPTFQDEPTVDTEDSEGRRVHHGGTSLYDALFLAADEVTSKQTGRRALVVLTDGVDVGSKETLTEAVEAAQRADTVVYAVYYKGEEGRGGQNGNRGGRNGNGGNNGGGGWPGSRYPGSGYPGGSGSGYPGGGGSGNPGGGGTGAPGGGSGSPSRKPGIDGKQVLEKICGDTGGRLFEASRKQTVEDIYRQIGEELRSQYRLGFTPDEAAARRGYHAIDLAVTGPDKGRKVEVQTRDGYYAGSGH